MIHLLSSYILWHVDTGGTENSISEISQEWWTRRLWTFDMFEPTLVLIILGVNYSLWTVLLGPFDDTLLFVTMDTRGDGKQSKWIFSRMVNGEIVDFWYV